MKISTNWHASTAEESLGQPQTSQTGLTETEANLRLQRNGENQLRENRLNRYGGYFSRNSKVF